MHRWHSRCSTLVTKVGTERKRRLNYVVDNSGDTAGALATWRNRTRRRRIDPFAAGCRCRDSRHKFVDGQTRSLIGSFGRPLAFGL